MKTRYYWEAIHKCANTLMMHMTAKIELMITERKVEAFQSIANELKRALQLTDPALLANMMLHPDATTVLQAMAIHTDQRSPQEQACTMTMVDFANMGKRTMETVCTNMSTKVNLLISKAGMLKHDVEIHAADYRGQIAGLGHKIHEARKAPRPALALEDIVNGVGRTKGRTSEKETDKEDASDDGDINDLFGDADEDLDEEEDDSVQLLALTGDPGRRADATDAMPEANNKGLVRTTTTVPATMAKASTPPPPKHQEMNGGADGAMLVMEIYKKLTDHQRHLSVHITNFTETDNPVFQSILTNLIRLDGDIKQVLDGLIDGSLSPRDPQTQQVLAEAQAEWFCNK